MCTPSVHTEALADRVPEIIPSSAECRWDSFMNEPGDEKIAVQRLKQIFKG
jgi:hypothetical protein